MCRKRVLLAVLQSYYRSRATVHNGDRPGQCQMLARQRAYRLPNYLFSLSTSPVGLCTSGRFIGGINGKFVFIATAWSPYQDREGTGVVHYTGDITISTRQVAISSIKSRGFINPSPAVQGALGAVSTITGGTGRYAGASGRIRIAGTFTPEEGGEASTMANLYAITEYVRDRCCWRIRE